MQQELLQAQVNASLQNKKGGTRLLMVAELKLLTTLLLFTLTCTGQVIYIFCKSPISLPKHGSQASDSMHSAGQTLLSITIQVHTSYTAAAMPRDRNSHKKIELSAHAT